MYIISIYRKNIIEYVHLIFMFIVLYFVARKHYLLLHTTAELVTVIFGIILIAITLNTIKAYKNKYLHILALIFSAFGIVSLLIDDFDEIFQVGILLQYYECILLNLSIAYINKKLNWNKIFLGNIILVILFILCIIGFKELQGTYIESSDLILFDNISGVLFFLGFIIFLFRIIRSKADIVNNNKSRLILVIFFKVISCTSFTFSNSPNSKFNVLGHISLNVSFYYMFIVILKEILINPYNTLFKKLKNKSKELERVSEKLDKVENKAQSMEKLNEKFINLIPDGILIVRDKKIQSANNRFLNMFEIEDEMELENMNFTEIIDSSYHEIFEFRINHMDQSILEKPQEYEFIWGTTKKWVETTSLIVKDDEGEYIISAIRNIEDRKKAEEAEKLLEIKNEEENLKNDFFANISHELRTPINVIYSALQVQNDYFKDDDSMKPVIKYNEIIKQNSLRLMRLINNIIDITRIESCFFKPNYKVENIIYIVEEITMSIVEYVKSKNINLVFDTEVEEAYVYCDSNLIERIMLNLLSNAVKYGKDGGNISVYMYQYSEDKMLISVRDDGIGIPDEMRRKIFDRFLKVDNSLSRKTEGSGIGLSLVKELVEIHDGSITCYSQLDVGTEFIILLPTVEQPSEILCSNREHKNYSQNAIKPAEIEFSDIYY